MTSLSRAGRTKSIRQHLEKVLDGMEQAGLRLKQSKCSFMASSIVYLDHRVDVEGFHPNPDKVDAIVPAPRPRSVSELKAYLGLLTYYGRFLPNLSTVLAPLYALLKWTPPGVGVKELREPFKAPRCCWFLGGACTFYPELKLLLACDASPYGIGAVLSHHMPDCSEWASHLLCKH